MRPQKLYTFLKHVFIPHEANDYKPHFFRELTIVILLMLGVFLLGISAGSSFFLKKTVLGASIAASVLVDLTNETRLAYNETPLTRNPLLDQAALLKGQDMTTRGYFAHDSPDGVTPWHWFKEVGYVFLYAGENLAVNFTESNEVQKAWLNSPKHRDNLLNVNFSEIGIATVEGIYKDNPTIFVVQMFGKPAVLKAATPKEERATSTTLVPSKEKEVTTAITSSTSITQAGKPEVMGESLETQKALVQADSQKIPAIEKILENDEVVVVKNKEEVVATTSATTPVTYAPWYGRYLFDGSDYIDTTYKILIGITLVALLLMVLVEIKRQHYKHISYGVLVIIVFLILIYINKAFIN